MNPTTILAITQGVNLIATVGPIFLDAAIKFREQFSRGAATGTEPPFEVQIQVYKDGVLKTINETDAIIAAWMTAHPKPGV